MYLENKPLIQNDVAQRKKKRFSKMDENLIFTI